MVEPDEWTEEPKPFEHADETIVDGLPPDILPASPAGRQKLKIYVDGISAIIVAERTRNTWTKTAKADHGGRFATSRKLRSRSALPASMTS